MSWGALVGGLVSGFFGDRSAKQASESDLESTRAIIDANEAAEQRTFDRAVPLYDAQFDNRRMAGQSNLDIINNLYPAIGNTVTDASMQAQRLNQGGLNAGINSILGIGNPTDNSWADPYQVQSHFRNNYALPDFIKPSEALSGVISGNASTGPGGTPGYDPGLPNTPAIRDAANRNQLVSQSGAGYRTGQPTIAGQNNFSNNDIVGNMNNMFNRQQDMGLNPLTGATLGSDYQVRDVGTGYNPNSVFNTGFDAYMNQPGNMPLQYDRSGLDQMMGQDMYQLNRNMGTYDPFTASFDEVGYNAGLNADNVRNATFWEEALHGLTSGLVGETGQVNMPATGIDAFDNEFEMAPETRQILDQLEQAESQRLKQQRNADTHRQNLVNMSLAPLLSGYQDPTFSLTGNRTRRMS
jgi:hypothetical protein